MKFFNDWVDKPSERILAVLALVLLLIGVIGVGGVFLSDSLNLSELTEEIFKCIGFGGLGLMCLF